MHPRWNDTRRPSPCYAANVVPVVRWTCVAMVALAWFSLPPRCAAYADLTSVEIQQRSQDVQRMTAIERARLQRNWQTFQKLSAAEQQHYRELHRELQQDPGQLKQLAATYSEWLQTLNPGQRVDLRQAKDPNQKLALVQKFKEEQDQQQEGRTLDEDSSTSNRDHWLRWSLGWILQHKRPLPPSKLKAAMESLAGRLSAEEQSRIAGHEKWVQYREILEGSAHAAGNATDWPNREQQEAIRDALKESDQIRSSERFTDEMRRNSIGRLIVGSLMADMLEDSKRFRPTENEFEQILQNLEDYERDELIRLPRWKLEDELSKKYYHQRSDQPFQQFMETKQKFLNFLFQFVKDAHFVKDARMRGGFNGRRGPPGSGGPRDVERSREAGLDGPLPEGAASRTRRGGPRDGQRNPMPDGE
jgi:hypothetical protein